MRVISFPFPTIFASQLQLFVFCFLLIIRRVSRRFGVNFENFSTVSVTRDRLKKPSHLLFPRCFTASLSAVATKVVTCLLRSSSVVVGETTPHFHRGSLCAAERQRRELQAFNFLFGLIAVNWWWRIATNDTSQLLIHRCSVKCARWCVAQGVLGRNRFHGWGAQVPQGTDFARKKVPTVTQTRCKP